MEFYNQQSSLNNRYVISIKQIYHSLGRLNLQINIFYAMKIELRHYTDITIDI